MVESLPVSGFTFNDNGSTVTHNATGLVWKRCLEGQIFFDSSTPTNYADDQCTGTITTFNWKDALEQAQTVNSATTAFAGSRDWRVPNLKELRSIVEYCQVSNGTVPAVNPDIFPAASADYVWSSSPVVNSTTASLSWAVSFDNGIDDGKSRNTAYAMRLVRAGL